MITTEFRGYIDKLDAMRRAFFELSRCQNILFFSNSGTFLCLREADKIVHSERVSKGVRKNIAFAPQEENWTVHVARVCLPPPPCFRLGGNLHTTWRIQNFANFKKL